MRFLLINFFQIILFVILNSISIFIKASENNTINHSVLLKDSSWKSSFNSSNISSAGDINGDGYDDVIIYSNQCNKDEHDDALSGCNSLYLGSEDGLSSIPSWTIYTYLGINTSIAVGGDINGDGFDDVIINGYDRTKGTYVEVFHGSSEGLSIKPAWHKDQPQYNASLSSIPQYASGWGDSLSIVGDVNGDGYDDIVIGAYASVEKEDIGRGFIYDKGSAYLFLGSVNGLQPDSTWFVQAEEYGTRFAQYLSGAGDVNGDGYDDVIISAWSNNTVFLYLGSSTGLSRVPSKVIKSNREFSRFGESLSTAGDVNGDGFDDVIIGASSFNSNKGAAFLYLGSNKGLLDIPHWSKYEEQDKASFGSSVSRAGDINGDGFDDVIISATQYSNNFEYEGATFLFLGYEDGLSDIPVWVEEGRKERMFLGRYILGIGDVNGDTLPDIMIGDHLYLNTRAIKIALNKSNVIFNWGEANFTNLFPDNLRTSIFQEYIIRGPYETGNYMGTKNGKVYVFGEIWGGLIEINEIDTLYKQAQ